MKNVNKSMKEQRAFAELILKYYDSIREFRKKIRDSHSS